MTPKLSYELMNHWARASERRVLLIVGVRYTFSNFLIFASSRLHMPSSHIHIFTFSHLHISSSHIFASSHLLIFTSTHIIFTYSHLILTYHLRIFTSTHTIFTSSHLHIFTSYPHVFTSSLSLSPSFSFLSWGRGRCWRGATKWLPFRTKWWSIVKNWSNIAILGVPAFVCKRVVCKCVCVCNNVSVCVCV